MLLNPWREVRYLKQRVETQEKYIEVMRGHIQVYVRDRLVTQRELSYAHAALRRKNIQLKRFKASVELHKEYTRSHPPQPAR